MRPAIVIGALAAVAVAAAVALRYGARRLDSAVAATVERYGSAVTGTDVNVDGIDLALDGRARRARGCHGRQPREATRATTRSGSVERPSSSTWLHWPAKCPLSRSLS